MFSEVEKIALMAGKFLLEKKKGLKEIKPSYKENEGLVSEVDLESEKLIQDELSRLFPDHFFLGEEGTFENEDNFYLAKKAKHCWYVDPLDGTNNYLNNLDYYCVSIAHSTDGVIDYGIIYAPERDELYYAEKGKGSFYKNLRTGEVEKLDIKNYTQRPLNRSFAVTSLNSLGGKGREKLEAFYEINNTCLSERRFGSAALELCHTARGMFDVCWDFGLKPWDVNAGLLICEEAGYSTLNFSGEKVDPLDTSMLCVRKHLEKDILGILKKIFFK